MRTQPVHPEQLERAALETALREAGSREIRGNTAACPFHDDKHPSLSIFQGEDGIWRCKCHTETCQFHGDLFDVRKKAGDTANPFAKPKAVTPPPTAYPLDAIGLMVRATRGPFCYTNPDTKKAEMAVFRTDRPDGGKSFIQCSPAPGGPDWYMTAAPKPWPLYNRTRIRTAQRVVVVEGEGKVHALADVGIVATTSPGGASNAHHCDWSPLAGKDVVLWPDLDASGAKHMDNVTRLLFALTPMPRIRRIDPATLDLGEKDDVVDFLALIHGDAKLKADAVQTVIDAAGPVCPASEVWTQIEETIEGRRLSVALPWDTLTSGTRALLPGTVTIVCGPPGSSKSLMVLQAFCEWTGQGIPCAIYQLECDRVYHLRRALAQLDGRSELADDDWVYKNPAPMLEAWDKHRDRIALLSRRMFDAPDKAVKHADLLAWFKVQCEAGVRVLIVDPITALEPSAEPWIQDQAFMIDARRIIRKHGASLIVVTHPKKNRHGSGMDELAGGAAFQRFSDTVVWIDSVYPPEEKRVRSKLGTVAMTINRVAHIYKARNSIGCGWDIGFEFKGASLTMSERGMIVEDDE